MTPQHTTYEHNEAAIIEADRCPVCSESIALTDCPHTAAPDGALQAAHLAPFAVSVSRVGPTPVDIDPEAILWELAMQRSETLPAVLATIAHRRFAPFAGAADELLAINTVCHEFRAAIETKALEVLRGFTKGGAS